MSQVSQFRIFDTPTARAIQSLRDNKPTKNPKERINRYNERLKIYLIRNTQSVFNDYLNNRNIKNKQYTASQLSAETLRNKTPEEIEQIIKKIYISAVSAEALENQRLYNLRKQEEKRQEEQQRRRDIEDRLATDITARAVIPIKIRYKVWIQPNDTKEYEFTKDLSMNTTTARNIKRAINEYSQTRLSRDIFSNLLFNDKYAAESIFISKFEGVFSFNYSGKNPETEVYIILYDITITPATDIPVGIIDIDKGAIPDTFILAEEPETIYYEPVNRRRQPESTQRFKRQQINNLSVEYLTGNVVNIKNPDGVNCGKYAIAQFLEGRIRSNDWNEWKETQTITNETYAEILNKHGVNVKIFDITFSLILEYMVEGNKKTFYYMSANNHIYPLTKEAINRAKHYRTIDHERDPDAILTDTAKKIKINKQPSIQVEAINTEEVEFTHTLCPDRLIDIIRGNLKTNVKRYYISTPDGEHAYNELTRISYILRHKYNVVCNELYVGDNLTKLQFPNITITSTNCPSLIQSIGENADVFKYTLEQLHKYNGDELKPMNLTQEEKTQYFPIYSYNGFKLQEMKPTDEIHTYDRTASHPASLVYPFKFGISYFDVLTPRTITISKPEDITAGRYYIANVVGLFPLRSSGWYSDNTAYYCLLKGIIKPEQIIMYMKPTHTHNPDYFKDLFLGIYNNNKFTKKEKKARLNYFCGMLARTINTYITATYSTSADDYEYMKERGDVEIYEENAPYDQNPSCNIYDNDRENKYTRYIKRRVEYNPINYFYIYAQIKENEIIRLHEFIEELKPAEVVYIECDSVSVRGYVDEKAHNIAITENGEVAKMDQFKTEKTKEVRYKTPVYKHEEEQQKQPETPKGSIYTDNDPEYTTTYNMVVNDKKSVFIEARAGAGKSHLIKKIYNGLTDQGLKGLKITYTHASKCIIEAQTLNKTFTISNDGVFRHHPDKEIKKYDFIIIDEVALCPDTIIQVIKTALRLNKQLIISGDFYQLRPPTKDGVYTDCRANRMTLGYTLSRDLLYDLVYNAVILNYYHRYTVEDKIKIDAIIENLDLMPELTAEQIKTGTIAICYYNKTRKQYNADMSARYVAENPSLKRLTAGLTPTNDPELARKRQVIEIMAGMPVIAIESNETTVYNGFDGTITNISDEGQIMIQFKEIYGGHIISLNLCEFDNLFAVGYAMTVYRSQGKTIKEEFVILDVETMKEISGAIYTATTRATNINNVFRRKEQTTQTQ